MTLCSIHPNLHNHPTFIWFIPVHGQVKTERSLIGYTTPGRAENAPRMSRPGSAVITVVENKRKFSHRFGAGTVKAPRCQKASWNYDNVLGLFFPQGLEGWNLCAKNADTGKVADFGGQELPAPSDKLSGSQMDMEMCSLVHMRTFLRVSHRKLMGEVVGS